MANEIIKYHNDFNTLGLKNFNSQELDLLMTLFVIVKNQDTKNIELTFDEIKKICKYDNNQSNTKFIGSLVSTNKKLLNLNFTAISEDRLYIAQFVLFPTFIISEKEQLLTIAVNERFKWVLNELTSNFTRFELDEFVSLTSQYAKSCYKCLKQFRTTGTWEISIEQFRERLDIPKSYDFRKINQKVLTPIREELSSIFPKLQIKKQTRGRGGKVVGLEFSWKPEGVPKSDERVTSPKKKKQDGRKEYMQSGKSYSKKDLFDVFE